MTLSALSTLWSNYGHLPYAFEVIRDSIGLGPAAIHALMLIPALLVGWIAARIAFTLLSLRWVLASIGVLLLVLPLLIGYQHHSTWRWITISSTVRWYPGPWALLALTPLLVDLSRNWRQTHRFRFVLAHVALSSLGLTLYGLQADSMMVLLLAVTSVVTIVIARPIAGLFSVCATAVIVVALWDLFAPTSFGFMHWLYSGPSVDDAATFGFPYPDRGYSVWDASNWIGSSVDLTALHSRLPTPYWIFSLDIIAEDWVLTAVAGLFGRAAALGLVLISALFGVAVIRLASSRGQTETQWPYRVVQLWGWLVLTMATATVFNSMGYAVPSLAFPFVSYGVNITLVMSAVAGSAIGVAFHGTVRSPLPMLERIVTRAESALQATEAGLHGTAGRLFRR